MSAGKYDTANREILKTSKIYSDGKTQVPNSVVQILGLVPGKSRLVWIVENDKITIESSRQRR